MALVVGVPLEEGAIEVALVVVWLLEGGVQAGDVDVDVAVEVAEAGGVGLLFGAAFLPPYLPCNRAPSAATSPAAC